jgi:DNA-binding GntR family transcriptional regulator
MPTTERPAAVRLQRQTLAQSAAERLRSEIVQGVRAPGEMLAEPTIAAALGVSRAPLREALLELERDGLVEFDERGRTRVCTMTPEDFEDLYTLRLALEPAAAAQAAGRATDRELALLEANIADMKVVRELADLSRLDLEFHALVMRASGRRRLCAIWNSLRPQLELWLAAVHQKQGRVRGLTVKSHSELLAALQQGFAEPARQMMQRHIEGWYASLPTPPGCRVGCDQDREETN